MTNGYSSKHQHIPKNKKNKGKSDQSEANSNSNIAPYANHFFHRMRSGCSPISHLPSPKLKKERLWNSMMTRRGNKARMMMMLKWLLGKRSEVYGTLICCPAFFCSLWFWAWIDALWWRDSCVWIFVDNFQALSPIQGMDIPSWKKIDSTSI